ncbi:MAG: DUF3987 domain-containing protein [Candidatus Dormibacteria bacterium]
MMNMPSAWPTLEDAALHGLARELVDIVGPHTEADPAALLLSFLVAYGSAVGPGPYIVADGSRHSARLDVVLVGKTGRARKGTSFRHVRNVFTAADRPWTEARILSGLSSGEGLISAVGDGEADKEGMIVGAVEDKRLLVVEEEFARVLVVKGRESNTLSAVLRLAWDSGDLRTMTKKPQAATRAHISLLAHITVEELRRSLTETDRANGFANRLLFALVKRSRILPEGGQVDFPRFTSFARKVEMTLAKSRGIGQAQRSEEAADYWRGLYTRLVQDETDGLLGAIIGRAEAQVLRLSLIYALLDGSATIELSHLLAAEAVWDYSDASCRYIFADSLGDEVADRLLGAIRTAGAAGMDGTAQHALFGGHVPAQRRLAALALLEAKGLVTTSGESTGGRSRLVTFPCAESAESAESSGADLGGRDQPAADPVPVPAGARPRAAAAAGGAADVPASGAAALERVRQVFGPGVRLTSSRPRHGAQPDPAWDQIPWEALESGPEGRPA